MTDLINKLQIKIISDIKTKLEKNYETFRNEKITEIKTTPVVYTIRLDTEEEKTFSKFDFVKSAWSVKSQLLKHSKIKHREKKRLEITWMVTLWPLGKYQAATENRREHRWVEKTLEIKLYYYSNNIINYIIYSNYIIHILVIIYDMYIIYILYYL